MTSLQRLFTTLAIAAGIGTASAQFPYTYIINGVVSGCYPGQVVTIETGYLATPVQTLTVTVDSATCTFSATLLLNSLHGSFLATTPCMGAIQYAYDSTDFSFFLDTAYSIINFNCGGACQASFTVQQAGPWQMTTDNTSTGTAPLSYNWWMPDGSPSTAFEPGFTFSGPGVYGICLTLNDGGGCTSTLCDTVMVDSAGTIFTGAVWYDCLGVLMGPDVPGSACDDGDSTTVNDTWSPFCACAGTGFLVDCLGIPGGPNMPGTPCNDGNPFTINDTWDSTCVCIGGTASPCNADFWVLQAYDYDSLMGTATPIPYTLWVWNLSSGGSGTYSFTWDFGDGTSSTDPFPTHAYSGNGPYLLCLTIDDGIGCIDTYCDTVSIDSLGFYNGFTGGGGDERASGFTINVMAPITSAINEQPALHHLATWPNPASDMLTIGFASDRSGMVDVTIIGLDGKVARSGKVPVATGRNEIRMSVRDMNAGLYLVRIANERQVMSQRFVKAD